MTASNNPVPALVLASASPRRRQLLLERGLEFRVVEPHGVVEIAPPDLTPAEIVLANARLKAEAVAQAHPEAIVLGVDTLVALGSRVLGKPADMAEAEAMLEELNGRIHEVFSGVCLMRKVAGVQRLFVEVTRVKFRVLSAEERRAYLRRIGPLDKAGAYAAQDDEGELIEAMEGSLSNVIGLPMEALLKALAKF